MVALSEDEALLSKLFQYRFSEGRGLKGHSFGNLFLTALTDLTGDFAQAVKLSSEILASLGRIYPATNANVVLEAELENGGIVKGETKIGKSRSRIRRIHLQPRVCKPLPETLAAIEEADLITLGPGSLFTSVIPNLLVEGIAPAIQRSRALKAYFVNLMWQPGETIGFRASDHVEAIHLHAGMHAHRRGGGEYARHQRPPATPVRRPERALGAQRCRPPGGNGPASGGHRSARSGDSVRHDPRASAEVALQLAKRGQAARTRQVRVLGSVSRPSRLTPRMTSQINVVILAAGLGTRMKSKRAKVLHRAGGLHADRACGPASAPSRPRINATIVVGHQAEQVRALLAPLRRPFCRSNRAKGHRPCAAGLPRASLASETGTGGRAVWRLPAAFARHSPNWCAASYPAMQPQHVITTRLDDPTGYGRIVFGEQGDVRAIVEHKAATPATVAIPFINSGIYCFRADLLWKHSGEIRPDNPAHEYYLTDIVEILGRAGHTWPRWKWRTRRSCWASTRASNWPKWTRFSAKEKCRS
jgi:hypothetical protein